MTVVTSSHIVIDKNGTPRVAGTRLSVANIVIDTRKGLSLTQIHEYYPPLSMAQIHAALSYYYDHKSEVDKYIEDADRMVEELRRQAESDPDYIQRHEKLRQYRARMVEEKE